MKRKWIVALLMGSILCTGFCSLAMPFEAETETEEETEEERISEKELEALKEKLEKEISSYGNEEEPDAFGLFTAFLGNSASPEDFFAAAQASEEFYCVEEEGMYYEEAMICSVPDSFNTEEYNPILQKGFVPVLADPVSTFAADVDTGSYCNLRRMVRKDGYSLENIPVDVLRTEEALNYFDYSVEQHSDGAFSVQYETADCPWTEGNELLLMTIEANKTSGPSEGNNFVYLIDTSGSMDEADKIALAKCSFKLLSYTLTEKDTVSIVTYAGDSMTVLEGCPGNDYETICEALDSIIPYGGTNGSGGIEAAYRVASEYSIDGGNNRVFIASDGDMNLGITSQAGLVDLISQKKESGIFLTTLGFGSGNYSDANMEQIADAGNGNYFYIDCLDEAERVLIEKQKQTTLTAAKDVKFQVEFNPYMVSEYRLLGYENREVADTDFRNDTVDGGEVGEGQSVTVLYELVPASVQQEESKNGGGLKYQSDRSLTEEARSEELLTLSVNYKEPKEETSKTESYVVTETDGEASPDMNLAISVAELCMLVQNSPYAENISLTQAEAYAKKAIIPGESDRTDYMLLLDQLGR